MKVAAIYFDDVYVLTPISLVRDEKLLEYYEGMVQMLVSNYRDSLGLEAVPKEVLEQNQNFVEATLEFQQQAEPLIDEGIVKLVNPFDEMRNVGLEKEFRKIIKYRSFQALQNHKQSKEPMSYWIVSGITL